MNKDNTVVLREYDVRFSWQRRFVKSESVAHAMEQRADGSFRLRILRPDTRHVPASSLFRKGIHIQRTLAPRKMANTRCAICIANSGGTALPT